MSRNANGRFSEVPTAKISRSRFDRSSSIKTTFNAGDLIPFYVDEVLPGDTWSVDTAKVVRMSTLIAPIMDNLYLDTYYFFVPNRLVWEHWVNLMGENTQSAWVSPATYTVPQVTAPSGGWTVGTVADYMGIPINVAGLSVNALPFRAYALVCNDWFRDENLSDPLLISTGDATQTGVNTGTQITTPALGGMPYKAAKLHDYFTSALPAPQKGPDVEIPAAGGLAPVVTRDAVVDLGTPLVPLRYADVTGALSNTVGAVLSVNRAGGTVSNPLQAQAYNPGGSVAYGSNTIAPNNLWANVGTLDNVTINSLRLAFQTQKYFEKLARGGSRYIESIKVNFDVTNPDYRLQRPEYLGGNRIPITINQVIQQSETTNDSPLGATGAQSLTTDRHSDFTKSFTEHGYIIGIMVARYPHTYQQGLSKMWSRRDVLDFYFPVFANLGEMPIRNKEIYAQGTSVDDEVFGYQEAWAEYRYRPSIATAYMRSTAPISLDVWHLGDNYNTLPSLSSSWIQEDSSIIDRTLAVSSSITHQFLADIYVKCKTTRPMPVYSVPGLIDHH